MQARLAQYQACGIAQPGPNVKKHVSITNLLSTENSCLTQTLAYQPKFRYANHVATGAQLISYAYQRNLISSIFCLRALWNWVVDGEILPNFIPVAPFDTAADSQTVARHYKIMLTRLKEHVALDRVSWSIKKRLKPFDMKCIWLERCFKSRIMIHTSIT